MTYQERTFYETDEQKYIIEKNEGFLTWLSTTIEGGYKLQYKLSSMQELIDTITEWYEVKYPEMQLGALEGTKVYEEFQGIEQISQVMTTEQLLYRLAGLMSFEQYFILDCKSYSLSGSLKPKIPIEVLDLGVFKCFRYNRGLDYQLDENGVIISISDENGYYYPKNLTAEELLGVLRKTDKYDLSGLKNSIFNYYSDIELRHRILQLAALSILYSKNTNPERGFVRARLFIKEFNHDLGLNLSAAEIDEIMYQIFDYRMPILYSEENGRTL